MNRNILVVAAHPDDEILGCGATMQRHLEQGDSIRIFIAGEGQTSRKVTRKETEKEVLTSLEKDALKAAAEIGIHDVTFGRLPDNRFDSLALLDIVKKVEAEKNRLTVDIVYTHHYGDLNIDHRCLFNAVMTAFRPQPDERRVDIFAYETLSSTEWQAALGDAVFKPTRFVSVTKEQIDCKCRALACYQTELRESPHPRSMEGVIRLAKWRGMSIGNEYAEAFEVIRSFG